MKRFDVLIVGGGHGGAQAAIALRQLGFAGSIGIVNAEPELPYERPPLSKEYLAGEKAFDRMLIRPAAFWQERDVSILSGRSALRVDPAAKSIDLADGETLAYGSLVWATGGIPRRLSCEGGELQGVHAIRARADVDRMLAELPRVERVVVVGGGYIGLEAAAVLRKLDRSVVVVEALDRVLARVAGAAISRFYEDEHRAHGVDVRTGAAVERILGNNGRVSGVKLKGGALVPADMVVVGIGISPAVAPLLSAGAAGGNGVDVDAYCRTSLPDVYAIGDCAAQESRFAGGGRIRIESVQNATDQATTAAKAIVGRPEPYAAVPWFWSNQYDLRLQTVGISTGHDEEAVRGDPAARSFSVVYLREGRVVALDCVNAVRDYAQGRRLVAEGLRIDPAELRDAARPLKEL